MSADVLERECRHPTFVAITRNRKVGVVAQQKFLRRGWFDGIG